MAEVKVMFSKMTEAKFTTITPDAGTFYWVTKEGNAHDLYLGTQKLNNIDDITKAIDALSAAGGAIDDIKKTLNIIQGDENTDDSIKKQIKTAIDNLSQVAKDGKAESVIVADIAENFTGTEVDGVTVKNLEIILAELVTKINAAQNSGKLVIDAINGENGSNIAKSITFYQGGKTEENKIYTLNIPADMFGIGGEVITIADDATDIPEGLEAGKTYIKVNIGAGGEPFYIPVDKLIEYVKGSVGADTTVEVNETTHVVTVTINDGAIVNKMIADGTIAKTKLAQAVQDTLDKADSAVQTVSEGTVAGAIDVDGTSVSVHGLSTVATSGKAADVQYKAAVEADTENGTPATPEITVAQALTKLEEAMGEGGDIATQISNAITDLALGTASKKNEEDFDASGAADAVLGTESDTADKVTVYGVKAAVEAVASGLVWNEVE